MKRSIYYVNAKFVGNLLDFGQKLLKKMKTTYATIFD